MRWPATTVDSTGVISAEGHPSVASERLVRAGLIQKVSAGPSDYSTGRPPGVGISSHVI